MDKGHSNTYSNNMLIGVVLIKPRTKRIEAYCSLSRTRMSLGLESPKTMSLQSKTDLIGP